MSSGVAASTNSYESIATVNGTGSSGTITFSSIPSTYASLQIRYLARTSAAFTTDFVSLRFNSDSATNYAYHFIDGDGTTASAAAGASSNIMYSGETPAASAGGDLMGVGIIDIIDYAATTKAKTVRSFAGNDRNGSGDMRLTSNLWTSTAAVNRIDLTTFRSANWTSTTTFALYGIKGA